MRFSHLLKVSIAVCAVVSLAGCTFVFQRGRRSDVEKIETLSQQLDDLTRAKQLLEDRLAQEINDKQVSLKMMEKGLVITFVADVLFDSGKAKLKPEMFASIDKVARVLRENVPDLSVGIEGHTDNQPIKYSGWKSNWELSSARALSVLHFLSEQAGIDPGRLSISAYGEFKPIASNDTPEGKERNRRVEIVILPKLTKIKDTGVAPASPATQTENLK